MKIEFVVTSRHWRRGLAYRKLAKAAIEAALAETGLQLKRGVELSVHLIDDDQIRSINTQWRQKDAPTNVLSFPAVEAAKIAQTRLLGDVLVAYETLAREAKDEGRTLADHFSHLIVHGFLHLVGYDHVVVEEAEAMERLEARALARLGVGDPYAERELADAAA